MASKYDYLIIGGGIAGITAAETIREQDSRGTIGIIAQEPHIIYSRVLLPSYLKRKIPREKLFLRKAEDFIQKKIDLLLGQEAVFVDIKKREVGLKERKSIGYQKLLLATGGRVKPWGREEDQDFIYRLQTLDDAERLLAALDSIKSPLVVGGSFISLELIEIFVLNNTPPSLLVRDEWCLGRILEARGGEILQENFARHGIRSYYKDSVASIEKRDGTLEILTKGMERIKADAISVGVGLNRNLEFLQGSGIELGKEGIRVNEFLETRI